MLLGLFFLMYNQSSHTKVLVYGILSCPMSILCLVSLYSIPATLGQWYCLIFHSWPCIQIPMSRFLLHAVEPGHHDLTFLSFVFSWYHFLQRTYNVHLLWLSSVTNRLCFHSCLLLAHRFAQLTTCLLSTYESVKYGAREKWGLTILPTQWLGEL